jgi:hypothetical protein
MRNPLHGRQSDAGAFKRFRWMEALEDAEQFASIFHIKSDSIVPNKHYDLIIGLLHVPDLDLSGCAGAGKLNRIGNQIH